MTGGRGIRRWVVAGGGTGGHVTPALALAEQIRDRGGEILMLGSDRGLETRLVPAAGFELLALPARPLLGRNWLAKLRSLPAMARACWTAFRALGGFGADFVISVGGYASVPAVIAAALRRVPIALVEPNAVPGRANRAAARLARRIFVQFDQAASSFGAAGADDRVRSVGIPLRRELIEAFAQAPPRRAPVAPFHLFVAGGSQGARQINEAMIEAAKQLDPQQLEIVHQTGDADRDRTEAAYRAAGLRAEVVAFESEMAKRYRWADLSLCRAGALTVAELAMAGLPALLVPYPYAADDHQTANARALVAAGAARILDSGTLDGDRVASALREIFAAPEQLQAMSQAASRMGRPDAAARIIDDCANQAGR